MQVDSVNASEPDMPDVTRVTVTVREREAGEYECTVTVMGREDNMPTEVVTLGTPESSTAMITGKLVMIKLPVCVLLGLLSESGDEVK